MATLIIFLMAGFVLELVTINTTRRLHRPHSIFVANLMITNMILSVLFCVMSAIMTIGYAIGAGGFINCNVNYFLFHPIVVIHFTMLMISVDKVIACYQISFQAQKNYDNLCHSKHMCHFMAFINGTYSSSAF